MRKLLVVIHTPVFGGPHNQMIQLANPLRERGWETLVVLPEEKGDGFDRLQAAGVPTVRLPWHRPRKSLNPRLTIEYVSQIGPEMRRLRSLIREEQVDVVQICGVMNIHAAVAAHLEKRPVCFQILSNFAPYPVRCVLMPVVVSVADSIMTTGVKVAKSHPFATSLGERCLSFFPPVDVDLFKMDDEVRAKARAELEVPEGAIVVGTIGNMSWQKGHEYFVEAAHRVVQQVPNAYFRILGAHTPTNAAYYQKNVRELATKYGLDEGNRLKFMSPGARVKELLPAFDIFALSSRAEGVPTAILEAMSCGLPVVSSDVGSISEVVEEGVTGYLFPRGQFEVLSDRLLRLIKDPQLRASLGETARLRAVERYDLKPSVDVHCLAYERAVKHRQSR